MPDSILLSQNFSTAAGTRVLLHLHIPLRGLGHSLCALATEQGDVTFNPYDDGQENDHLNDKIKNRATVGVDRMWRGVVTIAAADLANVGADENGTENVTNRQNQVKYIDWDKMA